jgi:hypothetical protein
MQMDSQHNPNSALSAEIQFVLTSIKHLADNQTMLGRLHDLLAHNIHEEKELMSQITDWAATEQASLNAISGTLDGIVTGIAALNALITNFQNSPGTLSGPDQAALDAIQAASQALVTKSAAISVNAPVPTPAA